MALLCHVVLSASTYTAGATPPPTATLVCTNTGASSVVVMGVQLTGRVLGSSTLGNPVPMANALPPYGPGAPVVVAAGGIGRVGPFPVTVASAADANSSSQQRTQVPVCILMVGATVFGSDRSVNVAAEAGITVSWTIRPAFNTRGGLLDFSRPSNSAGWFL